MDLDDHVCPDDDARVVDSIGSNADIHRKRRTNVVADGLGSIN
jgi:hypothetical protein